MAEIETVKSIDDEFTRTNHHLNAFGFTEQDVILREHQVKLMCEAYPGLNIGHAELIWNYCKREDPEEIKKNIASGFYEKKSTKYRNGGTIKCGCVYDKGEECPMEIPEIPDDN
tara:strand:+ start:85 stop:426 length:342 start_codon:yes stop_codon:yes gene_type:complete